MQRAVYDTSSGRKLYPGLFSKKHSEKKARKTTQELLKREVESWGKIDKKRK